MLEFYPVDNVRGGITHNLPIVPTVNVLETRFESLYGKYTIVTYFTREILIAYSREVQVDGQCNPEKFCFI